MESSCPSDFECRDEIAALLASSPPSAVQEYFDRLIASRQCGSIRVEQKEHGKGVYAGRQVEEEEQVLKDQMLVGAQHTSNKMECLVCSHCFGFIGSIELQIGRRLYFQTLGSVSDGHRHEKLPPSGQSCSSDDESGSCNYSDGKDPIRIPSDIVQSLMDGHLTLPYSKEFTLPSVVSCPGECDEEHYCSKSCADADWELCHSLLCTGKGGLSKNEALHKFVEHANGTNDIFLLAAKVISSTILQHKKLKSSRAGGQKHDLKFNGMDISTFPLLLEAWKPMSMAFKRRWWECISLPDDVDSRDEESFRMQIRELAFTKFLTNEPLYSFEFSSCLDFSFESLQLLKEAIFDKDCASLFSLEIYGHIIGMFELNNLDLVVASPVEDYFILVDDLPAPEKVEVEKTTRPFLDALGDGYSICCQGTAFFPIQSCINHSCMPNAKAFKRDEDRDGQAIIIATRTIRKGEEITISYIDEDLPFEERQAQLADYGFRCRCPKCLEEDPES